LTEPRRGDIGVVMSRPSLRDSHPAALYERSPGTVALIDESYRVHTSLGSNPHTCYAFSSASRSASSSAHTAAL
jgi:hypothetical protein